MRLSEKLKASGVLAHVVLPPGIAAILGALEIDGPETSPAAGVILGRVRLAGDLSQSPLPGFDLGLSLPTEPVDPAPFKLLLEPAVAPTKFSFWLVLSEQGQALVVFRPVRALPGMALTAATIDESQGFARLVPVPGRTPMLVSRSRQPGAALGPALLISGGPDAPAAMRFAADTDTRAGVIEFGLDPPAVMFGTSGVGVHIPSIVIDHSDTEKADGTGAAGIPPGSAFDPDQPAWTGILMRKVDFYLPETVPLVGGRPIGGYAALADGGTTEVVVEVTVPEQLPSGSRPARPEVRVRIECRDPTAVGLSALVPTLVAASIKLPDGPMSAPIGPGSVSFLRGADLTLRATLSRDPVNAAAEFRVAVAATAEGSDGLVSVASGAGLGAAKIFNVAAALPTALIAGGHAPGQSDLVTFAAAGAALSALFEDESRFVLHGVEVASEGEGAPVGGPVSMKLDYSVSARVRKIDVAGLSVGMTPNVPMRIRIRGGRLTLDPRKGGAGMFDLDFEHADVEIENPGAWDIGALDRLFDVLGSRNGRGSTWIEVDLRFKLNLGPVEISTLTLRASLVGSDREITLRGMAARLTVPGALDGDGALHLANGGFSASLEVSVLPLQLGIGGGLSHGEGRTLIDLAVDLPAPIPLANSGLGLFGIGGLVAVSAVPRIDHGGDPVLAQLRWKPKDPGAYETRDGALTLGFEAAVGTLPDFGFTVSAKAGLVISVPDIAVRGPLNGRVLTVPARLTDPSEPPPPPSISYLGLVNIDADALTFVLVGEADLSPLLLVRVPIAGHFPMSDKAEDWYTYLGADGAPTQDRALGPIQARVLPGIFDIGADAYLMVRGKGIEAWPHGRPLPRGPLTLADGFVIAFGFALQSTFGPRPLAWAELYASLDMLIGAKPPTLSGFGRAGGSLNLGPFSLGVEAQVSFFAQQERRYLWCSVTGRIELLFFDIEGTVTISFGDAEAAPQMRPPDRHPLDRAVEGDGLSSTPVLTDDSYRVVAPMVERPEQIGSHTVWPDALVSIPFAAMPVVDAGGFAQFPGVRDAPPAPARLGTEMMWHEWHLRDITLVEVDAADPFGPGTPVGGGNEIAARWQVGRVGEDDIAELVLFSTAGDLWVNRRATSKGLPRDPIDDVVNVCEARARPEPGWAIGVGGTPAGRGFRLPPETLSPRRLVSRVEAVMTHWAGEEERWMPLDRGGAIPAGYEVVPAVVADWAESTAIEGHAFAGHIAAPRLDRVVEADQLLRIIAQGQVLRTADWLARGVLLLAVRREVLEVGEPGIFVSSDQGDPAEGHEMDAVGALPWDAEGQVAEVGDGWVAVAFRQPMDGGRPDGDQEVRMVRIVHPLGQDLAVIGLEGITRTARMAAEARNHALDAATYDLFFAKQVGIPTRHNLFARFRRAVLSPGRLYRLDIDMYWTGELFRQDASGGAEPSGQSEANGTAYLRNGASAPTFRQLFFRTTAQGNGSRPAASDRAIAQWIHKSHATFEPEMIERYLGGYEPGQSELFRFARDPLRVHFTQNHVNVLADAYGFKLDVAVRRVDRPGAESAAPITPDLKWSVATDPKFLRRIDRERFAAIVASPCDQLLPGATATLLPDLAPEAWYEVYVRALPGNGRLPGVTFRTSRWLDPADMVAGLGFEGVAGAPAGERPVTLGDLQIAECPPARSASDGAFVAALAAMGLEGWPAPSRPRLSRLWLAGPDRRWLCAGLMVESIEPIARANRLAVRPLSLEGGATGFAVQSDGAGFRLLFLAATPFVPTGAERFSFAVEAPDHAELARGTLAIPTQPGFAADPR